MTEELKPCPFCGGRALTDYDDDDYPIVQCQFCSARTDWFEKIEDAIKSWNNRV